MCSPCRASNTIKITLQHKHKTCQLLSKYTAKTNTGMHYTLKRVNGLFSVQHCNQCYWSVWLICVLHSITLTRLQVQRAHQLQRHTDISRHTFRPQSFEMDDVGRSFRRQQLVVQTFTKCSIRIAQMPTLKMLCRLNVCRPNVCRV